MSGEKSNKDKALAELFVKQGHVPGTPLENIQSDPLATPKGTVNKQKLEQAKKTLSDLGELFYDPVGNNLANLDVEKFSRVRTSLKEGKPLSISERIFLLRSLSYKLEPEEKKTLLQKQKDFGKYGLIAGGVGLGTGIMFNIMFKNYLKRSFLVKFLCDKNTQNTQNPEKSELCFTPIFCFSVYFQLSPLLIDYNNFTENLEKKYSVVLASEVEAIHGKIEAYDGWSKKGMQKIRALQLQSEKESNDRLLRKKPETPRN